MNKLMCLAVVCLALMFCGCDDGFGPDADGWYTIFDGKTWNGWQASNENVATFSIDPEKGVIKANGDRCHLFYVGEVSEGDFTNFEFKADVMTLPNSNSGIFFHTKYKESGWPNKGYESQINNTYAADPQKSGTLWGASEVVTESPMKDNEWYTQHIIVKGKHVIVKLNDQVVVDYTEADDWLNPMNPDQKISSGTFALQGHDPGSTVYFKNIKVKPLD